MPVGNSPRYTYHGHILGLCGLFYSPHTTNTSKRNSQGVSLEKLLQLDWLGSTNQKIKIPIRQNQQTSTRELTIALVTTSHLNTTIKTWGCASGAVYVPCVYSHARSALPLSLCVYVWRPGERWSAPLFVVSAQAPWASFCFRLYPLGILPTTTLTKMTNPYSEK